MGLMALIPSGAKMAIVAALVAAAGALYWHYTTVVSDRNEALAKVGALEVENQVQDETITTLETRIDEWAEANKRLQEVVSEMAEAQREATAEQRRLTDVLSKHDLTALSLAKPGLLERRINSGTARIFRMFECASGGGSDCAGGSGPAGSEAGSP